MTTILNTMLLILLISSCSGASSSSNVKTRSTLNYEYETEILKEELKELKKKKELLAKYSEALEEEIEEKGLVISKQEELIKGLNEEIEVLKK